MRSIVMVRDLCIAFLVGGLGAVFLMVTILFERSPSRETAGQVGNALFNELGPVVFILSLFLVAGSVLTRGQERSRRTAATSLALSVLCAVLAGFVALWLTPRMDGIWQTAPHADDGTGLLGEARSRFMAYHVMTSTAYLVIWLCGIALSLLRSWRGAYPDGSTR